MSLMNPTHPSTVGNLKCLKFFTVNNNSAINMKVKVAQSCPTLWDPMDYTVHGILQARILEWVAYPLSSGSAQPRNRPGSPALQADSLPTELWGKPCEEICVHISTYFFRIDFQKWNYRSKAVILYTHTHTHIYIYKIQITWPSCYHWL